MKNQEFRKTFKNSAVIFIFSLALLIIISALWGRFTAENNFTGILESLSTAVAAAAVFAAAYFGYQELDEISKTRHIEVADRLFDELNSPESIKARRLIFQNLKGSPGQAFDQLTQEERDAIKTVLNSLDRVAFLTQSGWIPNELIMPWMHPMITKSWEKLEPYVLYERQRRNEPYFYNHAGKLAERCKQWRAEHLPEAERITNWVDKAL